MPSSFASTGGQTSGGSGKYSGGGGGELELGLGLGLGLGMDHNGRDNTIDTGLGVPSHSAWAALIDDNGQSNQNQDRSSSMNEFVDGSPSMNKDCDDADYLLQGLRIQASEFQPTSSDFQSHDISGNGNGFMWSSNNIS